VSAAQRLFVFSGSRMKSLTRLFRWRAKQNANPDAAE
jgi:hypothetical protein